MSTSTQLGEDVFGILLYRNDATELLLESTPAGLAIPVLPVPAHSRIAAEITAAINGAWGLDTYCLFSLAGGTHSSTLTPCQVAEVCWPRTSAPTGMRWVPLTWLSARSFVDSRDCEVIEKSLAILDQYRRGEFQGAFGKPGWLSVVSDWVRAAAAEVGLSLTGEFRQFNASPTFSLMRFETDGPAVWLKAVGEPNLHEFPITLKLCERFSDFVPKLIDHRRDWCAWLTFEAEGTSLDACTTAASWSRAAQSLADLQISSMPKIDGFVELGCKDVTRTGLLPIVEPFVEYVAELMNRQTRNQPRPLERRELRALASEIRQSIQALADSGFADTLGHLDLNPGNVFVGANRCTFLDWAEACVGHPFLTFQYLVEHGHRIGVSSQSMMQFRASYAAKWHRVVSPSSLDLAFLHSPLVAVFAFATAGLDWSQDHFRSRPDADGFLRSLTRRMHREALALPREETLWAS